MLHQLGTRNAVLRSHRDGLFSTPPDPRDHLADPGHAGCAGHAPRPRISPPRLTCGRRGLSSLHRRQAPWSDASVGSGVECESLLSGRRAPQVLRLCQRGAGVHHAGVPLSLRSASRRSPRMQSLFDHFLSLQASPSSRSPIPTVTALVSPSVTESGFTSITGGDDQADGGDARPTTAGRATRRIRTHVRRSAAEETGLGPFPHPMGKGVSLLSMAVRY